ncbi:SGNH/GDSL hydrolase family protein [Planococcus halotolerans]|uniref:SGNH/GDSL hydrolase family protein n=1 Tax=Planococcus halotolerans TaxID=2233542 RepID=UPI0010918746|nr:SGNH/GDSL hydrolase family protein [Planococcus halotolerans]QHJ71245.1 lipolytic protein G-D-S-L family [Planococcus halotolerans]
MSKIRMAIPMAFIIFSLIFLSACAEEDFEPMTLVALGDSITASANLVNSEQSGYPYLIGEEAGLEVHNLAVSGWQTGQVTEALREDETYQTLVKDADYIAMTIGGNDLLRILRNAQTESAGDPMIMTEIILQELSSNNVSAELGELIEEIRSLTDAKILLYNIYNPLPPSSNLHGIGESLLPQINAAYAEIAEIHENVFLADAFLAYQEKQADYIIEGDIHPTEEGQAALAEIGLEALGLE